MLQSKIQATKFTGNQIKILSKPKENKPTNRIIETELSESVKLDYKGDYYVYGTLKVSESGYYSINSQMTIQATEDVELHTLQFGLCLDDLSDFGNALNSKVLNTKCLSETVLSDNLTTFKELDSTKTYIIWLNITSENNKQLQYLKEFSHLFVIKL